MYYLNPEREKIISPVTVKIDGDEMKFDNGQELAAHRFSKPYIVKSIRVAGEEIEIDLIEKEIKVTESWF